MFRKLIVAGLLALALAACGGSHASPQTAAPDPGVEACKASARRQANPATPTLAQREASWNQYQQSRYPALQDVGVNLERAWRQGTLADQVEAALDLIIVCGQYGVEVKVK